MIKTQVRRNQTRSSLKLGRGEVGGVLVPEFGVEGRTMREKKERVERGEVVMR